MQQDTLIIGCNGSVAAIRTDDGLELWRTKLRQGILGGSYGSDVSVLIEGDRIFAGCSGRIYALDAATGSIIWSNDLSGLGFNEVALARPGTSVQYITRVESRTQNT